MITYIKAFFKKHDFSVLIIIGVIIISVFIAYIIYNIYNELPDNKTLIYTSGDILIYCGTVVTAAATLFLGIIANKQNRRLIALEQNNFIASYSSFAYINKISFKGIRQTAINMSTNHEEQILFSNSVNNDTNYNTIQFDCELCPIEKFQHVSFIYVSNVRLFVSKSNNTIDCNIELSNKKSEYSRVAISNNSDVFSCTAVITENEKKELINSLQNNNSSISLLMNYSLLSDKYVKSDFKCKATLHNQHISNTNNNIICFKAQNDNAPFNFFYGNEIIQADKVNIK